MGRTCLVGGLLAVSLSGCFTITYRGNHDYTGVERSEWGDYFLWGLVGEIVVDLGSECPTASLAGRASRPSFRGFWRR